MHMAIKRAVIRAAVDLDDMKLPTEHTNLSGERQSSLMGPARQHKEALLGRYFDSLHFADAIPEQSVELTMT